MHQAQLHAFSGLYTQWLQRQLQAHVGSLSLPDQVALRLPQPGMLPLSSPGVSTLPPPEELDDEEEKLELPPEFYSSKPDIVLVSLEGVEFPTQKLFLSVGSAFFRRMFEDASSDASTSTSASPDPYTNELERVPWPEKASTIVHLLQLLYPLPKPRFPSLGVTLQLLLSADKWELALPLQRLKDSLLTKWAKERPLRVYGFLCSSGLGTQEEIRAVAEECLARCDPREGRWKRDLEGMSALALSSLLDARDARAAQAQKVVQREVPSHCPHGFPLATAALVGQWKAALGERLARWPTGRVMDGWESIAEVLWPEGVAASCRLCIPTEARRACIEKVAKAQWDIDALPITL
ncbi:hypothetical protein DACRYDRAFT_116255 [Dacryopinax primogenitus]|uniref:BTB domain-containing protein n=1 Tax=Dacryopinax primogenitus (strain DJM 731) TaxID=1858805 RepID=M5G0Z3_DACPD|nr:uncharacterized protein DACRYDRAFT_116255 [Dacryopinax primogenitus]EJU01815.1 hypothetical protein DACRYDRAFT_116255 [Dacryopinax primogenitus]